MKLYDPQKSTDWFLDLHSRLIRISTKIIILSTSKHVQTCPICIHQTFLRCVLWCVRIYFKNLRYSVRICVSKNLLQLDEISTSVPSLVWWRKRLRFNYFSSDIIKRFTVESCIAKVKSRKMFRHSRTNPSSPHAAAQLCKTKNALDAPRHIPIDLLEGTLAANLKLQRYFAPNYCAGFPGAPPRTWSAERSTECSQIYSCKYSCRALNYPFAILARLLRILTGTLRRLKL